MHTPDADQDLFDLYDEYCHSDMPRREFLKRAAALTAAAGLVGCGTKPEDLLPDYSKTVTVAFTDPRIKARYVTYDSPGGNGPMRGYLVTPTRDGRFGAVLVVHENRGLNPYVQDVARRVAVEGFVAFAPDALAPLGGYPGNDDDGKVMQRSLDGEKLFTDLLNGARYLKGHELSTGKLGATGFCYGGGVVNRLAVVMGKDLDAGAPFYGSAPAMEDVPKISAPLLIHYAEDDQRINASREAYRAALEQHGKDFAMYTYEGTRHGFHNNSTPRYDEKQAEIAWERTIAFFRKHLA